MLNLTKGRRSVRALQPSAKGVTGVVSHYSSYPASFGEFLAPDAPEHSLLVNTSLSLIPACTLGHTHTHIFLISRWCTANTHLSVIAEDSNSILLSSLIQNSIERYCENILSRPLSNRPCIPLAIRWITLNVPQLETSNYNLWLNAPKRRPITTPYLSSLRPTIVLLLSNSVVTIRVSIVIVWYMPGD